MLCLISGTVPFVENLFYFVVCRLSRVAASRATLCCGVIAVASLPHRLYRHHWLLIAVASLVAELRL